jgi:hypothetical protein
MKAYRGSTVTTTFTPNLSTALMGYLEASATLLSGKNHGIHLIGGCVGPRTCLEVFKEEKTSWFEATI